MTSKYELYAIRFTLKGTIEEKKHIISFKNKPVTKQTLKKRMIEKLQTYFPEYKVYGGNEYFQITKEIFLEECEGKHIENIGL